MRLYGGRKPRRRPVARWLRETRAKARNPQKTKACAIPGSGRSRITLDWKRTSLVNVQMRLEIGRSEKPRSLRAVRMLRRIGAKRKKKSAAEAQARTSKRTISNEAKCCGSAKVTHGSYRYAGA